MIHKYSFENFQSFLKPAVVDFTLNEKVRANDWMVDCSIAGRVSQIMTVIGPNASGKTALLKPIVFLEWFIARSFSAKPDADIPFFPHFSATEKPTEFSVELDFDDALWRYELTCTRDKVLYEALHKKHERFRYVFIREWHSDTASYKVKQNDFGFPIKEAQKVRKNASLISTAAQYNVPLAQRLVNTSLSSNIHFSGRHTNRQESLFNAASHFNARPEQFDLLKQLLKSWDLGLDDIEIRELSRNEADADTRKRFIPVGKHKWSDGEAELPFLLESTGTQSAFILLAFLLQALTKGGIAVIDEFESDLHPHMLEPIINLFCNPTLNPHRAQLIFTCHAIEVLNILHKSQVMLVEKEGDAGSICCRLDEIKYIRPEDNYYAKYMAGAYGAVPNF
jgi:AAA15 family ATPase/GTPase